MAHTAVTQPTGFYVIAKPRYWGVAKSDPFSVRPTPPQVLTRRVQEVDTRSATVLSNLKLMENNYSCLLATNEALQFSPINCDVTRHSTTLGGATDEGKLDKCYK